MKGTRIIVGSIALLGFAVPVEGGRLVFLDDLMPVEEPRPDDPVAANFTEAEVRAIFGRMREADAKVLERAVRALNSTSFAERQAAEKELSGMFWITPERIRKQFGTVDAELEYRLARIGRGSEGEVRALVGSVRRLGVSRFAGELFELGAVIGGRGLLGEEILAVLRDFEGKIEDGDVLRKNLRHRYPGFRRAAMQFLARSSAEEGREAALAFLADIDDGVRLAAATVLIRAGERRGAVALVDLLESKDGDIRGTAHELLIALAKKELAGAKQHSEWRVWKKWVAGLPDPVPLPEGGFEELLYWDADGVRTKKRRYGVGEEIGVEVTKFSGSRTDWVTVTGKGVADTSYGQYFYGEGKKEGKFVFDGMEAPGEYEVRVYHDWPKGQYEVKARYGFSVE